MAHTISNHRIAAPRGFSPVTRLKHLFAIQKERLALGRLEDAALKDIGVTRAEANREASRTVWDAPAHWQR